MKFVIQRVLNSKVNVDGKTIGSIGKGNRPSFIKAGKSDFANEMYEWIINKCKTYEGLKVERGEFGADMKVELVNDGPFTIVLDSEELF